MLLFLETANALFPCFRKLVCRENRLFSRLKESKQKKRARKLNHWNLSMILMNEEIKRIYVDVLSFKFDEMKLFGFVFFCMYLFSILMVHLYNYDFIEYTVQSS